MLGLPLEASFALPLIPGGYLAPTLPSDGSAAGSSRASVSVRASSVGGGGGGGAWGPSLGLPQYAIQPVLNFTEQDREEGVRLGFIGKREQCIF